MSEKLFKRVIAAVTALGIISVIAIVAYTYHLYGECSIISYIANGR